MAEVGSVYVTIGAKIDELQKALATVKGQLGGANTQAKQTQSAFSGIWKQFTVGSLVSTGVNRAISAVKETLADTVRKGREFERAWANVTTVLFTSADEADRMKRELMKLDPALGDTTDLAKGMYEVLSASIEPTKAIAFLGEAAKSAKAGLTDVRTAVDVLTTVINAYGMKAEDVTKISDIMFQSVNVGKLTYEQMAAALGTVVPVAAQVGVSFDEIAAAMSTLTRSGVDANTTTTQLRQILVSVLKPTAEAAKLAKSLGLEFNSQALASKGLSGFLQDVTAKTGNSSDLMTVLFGNVRALSGVMGLAGQNAKAFSGDLEVMKAAAGSTETAFKKQMQSLDFWMNTFKTTTDKLKISFYEGFVTPIRDGIQTASDINKTIATLQDTFMGLGQAVGWLVNQGLKVFKEHIDRIQRANTEFLVSLEMIKAAFRGQFISMDEAIDRVIAMKAAHEGLTKTNQETARTITSVTDAIERGLSFYQEQAAYILANSKSSEEASSRLKTLQEFMASGGEAADDMGGSIGGLNDALQKLKEELGITFRADVVARIEKLNDALLMYRNKMTTAQIEAIRAEIDTLSRSLKVNLAPAADEVAKHVDTALAGIEGLALQAIREIQAGAEYTGEQVAADLERIAEGWKKVPDGAKPAVDDTRGMFDGLMNDIAQGFGNTIQEWLSGATTFRDFIKGVWEDIKSAFFRVIGQMVAEWTVNFVKKLITDTAEVGKSIAKHISGAIGGAGQAAGSMAGSFLSAASSISNIVTGVASVINLFKKSPTGAGDGMGRVVERQDQQTAILKSIIDFCRNDISKALLQYGVDYMGKTMDNTRRTVEWLQEINGTLRGMKGAYNGATLTRPQMVMTHGTTARPEHIIPDPDLRAMLAGNARVAQPSASMRPQQQVIQIYLDKNNKLAEYVLGTVKNGSQTNRLRGMAAASIQGA